MSPENVHLMNDLIARYGKARAQDVYWGMVGEAKGPFAAGGKYHYEHVAFAQRTAKSTIRAKRKARHRRR